MPRTRPQQSGPGIYFYDPEQHRERSEDALGTVSEANNGRTYLARFQELVIEMADGTEFQIKMNKDGTAFTARNRGARISTGIVVLPVSSNVIEVRSID